MTETCGVDRVELFVLKAEILWWWMCRANEDLRDGFLIFIIRNVQKHRRQRLLLYAPRLPFFHPNMKKQRQEKRNELQRSVRKDMFTRRFLRKGGGEKSESGDGSSVSAGKFCRRSR
ncbi:hypothetical protein MHYP_G00089960 [Metynnis hypsauchen]